MSPILAVLELSRASFFCLRIRCLVCVFNGQSVGEGLRWASDISPTLCDACSYFPLARSFLAVCSTNPCFVGYSLWCGRCSGTAKLITFDARLFSNKRVTWMCTNSGLIFFFFYVFCSYPPRGEKCTLNNLMVLIYSFYLLLLMLKKDKFTKPSSNVFLKSSFCTYIKLFTYVVSETSRSGGIREWGHGPNLCLRVYIYKNVFWSFLI